MLSRLAYAEDDSSDLALYVSSTPTDLRAAIEIDEGIYAERNTSTWLKLSLLKRFFRLFNADPADLVFYLRGEDKKEKDGDVGTRYETRKRYWTFALAHIHEAHGEDGLFYNVNPTRNNWINGYFGVSGFAVCCVANYDSARTEVVFGRVRREENKEAFDDLYRNRAKIEERLGASLLWNRGDDIKSSKVSLTLDNVSIDNEADWLQMARFHADWSKRFCDVIVPYIKDWQRNQESLTAEIDAG